MKRFRPEKGLRKDLKIVRETKWLLTNENWYPAYPDGKVRASFIGLSDGKWRVCVWGNDDFGLERDYEDRAEAKRMFERLPSPITQKQLLDWGFGNA